MTDPLPEHSGGSPENAPSGGRRGDRAEGMRLVFADRPGPLMLLLEVDTWPELRLEGRPVPGILPASLSDEDAVELERLSAMSSADLDAELAGLGVDPAPFLERMRAFVAALEPEHLPECSGWTRPPHDNARCRGHGGGGSSSLAAPCGLEAVSTVTFTRTV
jgi:hypothetical protein